MLILSIQGISAQNLKPYLLAIESTESVRIVKEKVVTALNGNGIEIVGEYMPAIDQNRWIIVFSSNELIGAVKNIGGISGFASTLRIGITKEQGKTVVSYTQPRYWGNAYFQKNFDKVSTQYQTLSTKLERAFSEVGVYKGTEFGSEDGISAEELRKYHYMFGMPYFDDTIELADFDSYNAAIQHIDSKIKSGVSNLKEVYKISIPGKELTLYGFALSGSDGEENFLPIIDIGEPKHTAFLPYEMLVIGNEVHMLHGRFRIALSFPDLTMGTFTKIMSTPGDIEDLLEQVVK